MRYNVFAFLLAYCIVNQGTALQAQQHLSLEDVIAVALERDYNIQLSRNELKSASTDNDFVWGAFVPRLNGVASTLWNETHQEFKFDDEARNSEGDARAHNIQGSVQLDWLLFDGTRMFATRQRLREIEAQGELLVKDQMVNTVAAVIVNYYDIVRQKQQMRAIREQMAVSEERVKLAELKLEVGTGGKPELLQAKVDLNAQLGQVIQQEAIIIQLKDQLNALTGLQLPSMYEVADTIIIDMNLSLPEIQNNIENTNYSLMAARANYSIARLALHERKGELAPMLNFNASYNLSQTDNIRLVNPFASRTSQFNGYNYGFTLNIPILNGLNTRRLVQQAHINVDRQQLLYDQQKVAVNVNLRNAFVNYENAKEILLIEEENILLAKENVFIALEGFKRGITTFIELRTAQQSLEEAYNRLINARYIAKVAETELQRLNGGLLTGVK